MMLIREVVLGMLVFWQGFMRLLNLRAIPTGESTEPAEADSLLDSRGLSPGESCRLLESTLEHGIRVELGDGDGLVWMDGEGITRTEVIPGLLDGEEGDRAEETAVRGIPQLLSNMSLQGRFRDRKRAKGTNG